MKLLILFVINILCNLFITTSPQLLPGSRLPVIDSGPGPAAEPGKFTSLAIFGMVYAIGICDIYVLILGKAYIYSSASRRGVYIHARLEYIVSLVFIVFSMMTRLTMFKLKRVRIITSY